MPAIHLPRLRKQVNELVPYCSEPNIFLVKLKDLFDYYGDRTLRPSQTAAKTTSIPSANVSQPVLRQVVSDLTPYAQTTPHIILDLCRELWDFGWLEHRLLACYLLGKLPQDHAAEILLLIEDWCRQNHEETLLRAIAERGLASLQRDNTDLLIAKAQEWINLASGQQALADSLPAAVLINFQKLGLRALIPLVEDPFYENLPKIYTTLKPTMAAPPKVLRTELLDLLRSLARRSPQETAFYLRRLNKESPTPTLSWLIRRTLSALPADLQESLRKLTKPGKPAQN